MKRKWIIAAAGALMLIGFLIAAGVREQADSQGKLAEAKKRAVELGAALDSQAFLALMPKPEPLDDAWPHYRKAIDILRPGFLDGRDSPAEPTISAVGVEALLDLLRSWRRTTVDLAELASHHETLKQLGPVFLELEAAASKPLMSSEKEWSRGLTLPVPEAGEIMRLGRLLILSGFVEAASGKADAFMVALKQAAAVARHLGQIPVMVYVNMGLALSTDVLEALSHMLRQGTIRFDQNGLDALLSELETKIVLQPTIQAMTYACLSSIKVLSSRESMVAAGITERWALRNVPKEQVRQDAELAAISGTAAILAKWPRDERDTLAMRAALGKEDLAMDDAMSLLSPMLRRAPPSDSESQIQRQGMFGRLVETAEAFHARLRLVKGLVAGLKAKARSGAFPKTLPLQGQDAVDPFDGKPLRFSSSPDGFLIYSVGANRVDDKGLDTRSERRPADITLRYPGGGSAL